MIGRVVSTKMNKTVTILVERIAKDPLYKKTYSRSKKYLVHTDIDLKDGDVVELIKFKPVSKNKHWKVVKVVGRDLAEIIEAKQKETVEKAIAEVMPEEKEEPKIELEETLDKKIDKKPKKKGKK